MQGQSCHFIEHNHHLGKGRMSLVEKDDNRYSGVVTINYCPKAVAAFAWIGRIGNLKERAQWPES